MEKGASHIQTVFCVAMQQPCRQPITQDADTGSHDDQGTSDAFQPIQPTDGFVDDKTGNPGQERRVDQSSQNFRPAIAEGIANGGSSPGDAMGNIGNH